MSVGLRGVMKMNLWITKCRQLFARPVVVEERYSPVSGMIQVIDHGRERRLVMKDGTHSLYLKKGSWNEIRREYWGSMLRTPFGLASRPKILLFGLGGATMLHLFHQEQFPCSTVVMERDPEIVDIAKKYFQLAELPETRVIVGDGLKNMEMLLRDQERFDMVIDDAFFDFDTIGIEGEITRIKHFSSLLLRGGTVVINLPIDHQTTVARYEELTDVLRRNNFSVKANIVRHRWSNYILYCQPEMKS